MDNNDFLVSYEVVLLFTKISINDAVDVIRKSIDSNKAKFIELSLKSTSFSFQGKKLRANKWHHNGFFTLNHYGEVVY